MVERRKIAYLFPGQGSQYVGMGSEFYQHFKSAKKIFDQTDEILDYSLTELCFEGPLDKLSQTQYCQIAILTTTIACLEVLKEVLLPTSFSLPPIYMAGHSLGEYSALVAAGGVEFEEAVNIVQQRAHFMQEQADKKPGGMVAILGLSPVQLERICQEEGVEMANLNCPGQIVISGDKRYLEKASQKALELGAKKTIPLTISGPFHSSLMKPAGEKLKDVLEKAKIKDTLIPIIANVSAKPVIRADEIKQALTSQISQSVLWEESMRLMIKEGINTFIEIGPGRVLKGLMRRISPEVEVKNIEKMADLGKIGEVK